MIDPQSGTAVHHALGDDRRARIVQELESSGGALDANELGGRVGLHANTVRWHLGILARAGILRSYPAPRQTPGRPRIVYELDRSAVQGPHDEYRLLATVLAGTIAQADGGVAASEHAGWAWGHALARRPDPHSEVDEEQGIAHVVDLLAEQGFEPRAEGRRIEMHRCPFHDLAETTPEVVCAVHRGLISGALAGLGQKLAVDRLEIFPRPDVCIARLARAEAASAPSGGSSRANGSSPPKRPVGAALVSPSTRGASAKTRSGLTT